MYSNEHHYPFSVIYMEEDHKFPTRLRHTFIHEAGHALIMLKHFKDYGNEEIAANQDGPFCELTCEDSIMAYNRDCESYMYKTFSEELKRLYASPETVNEAKRLLNLPQADLQLRLMPYKIGPYDLLAAKRFIKHWNIINGIYDNQEVENNLNESKQRKTITDFEKKKKLELDKRYHSNGIEEKDREVKDKVSKTIYGGTISKETIIQLSPTDSLKLAIKELIAEAQGRHKENPSFSKWNIYELEDLYEKIEKREVKKSITDEILAKFKKDFETIKNGIEHDPIIDSTASLSRIYHHSGAIYKNITGTR